MEWEKFKVHNDWMLHQAKNVEKIMSLLVHTKCPDGVVNPSSNTNCSECGVEVPSKVQNSMTLILNRNKLTES